LVSQTARDRYGACRIAVRAVAFNQDGVWEHEDIGIIFEALTGFEVPFKVLGERFTLTQQPSFGNASVAIWRRVRKLVE
jgi:hypothetical protein